MNLKASSRIFFSTPQSHMHHQWVGEARRKATNRPHLSPAMSWTLRGLAMFRARDSSFAKQPQDFEFPFLSAPP